MSKFCKRPCGLLTADELRERELNRQCTSFTIKAIAITCGPALLFALWSLLQ